MSIEPFDWFNRFFAGNRPFGQRNSLFEGFDEMRREMEENLKKILEISRIKYRKI